MRKKVIIMGAAGRDFHNFNVFYRDNKNYEVVAFTAAQIPNIAGRKYPSELAGKLYPDGIPIYEEEKLPQLIEEYGVDEVVFSYTDVSYKEVMNKSAIVNSAGADFVLLSPLHTMLKSSKPVIAICAVRTGCGKSQFSRKIFEILSEKKKVVAVRHPMPYGDLVKQKCQRFASYEDLDKHECTIEEREEYEPYIDMHGVVYAGVDYEEILRKAEKEADIIIWDGGNNDFPFYKPDLHIVVADPHRAGHEVSYYAGEINARMADYVIINKVDTANRGDVEKVRDNIKMINPRAKIIEAESPIKIEGKIEGKKVLVIEDGPTITHGEMKYGAATIVAKNLGLEIVDAKKYAVGSILETYKKYSHLEKVLPAMGYGKSQIEELEETINSADCDFVLSATPIDLKRILNVNKKIVRVRYGVGEKAEKELRIILKKFMD
ncbi:MAG: cyclic 2,3-diphosphoglycerate synthase [Candidatus Thermoplasmatota archaeon]